MRDHPPQPPEHHGHVRPEHAPAHVRLVDDHEREPEEEVGPPGVVGQERQVQHVRVGHHQVRVLPDQRPLRARRVAVVDGRLHLRDREGTHRSELVPRKGFRGEEVEGGRRGALDGLSRERQVVHQRLPARRPRRHDQVPVGGEDLEAVGLVRIEAADPHQFHPIPHQGRDPPRERRDHRLPRGQLPDVDERRRDEVVLGQRREERAGIHTADATGGRRSPRVRRALHAASRTRRGGAGGVVPGRPRAPTRRAPGRPSRRRSARRRATTPAPTRPR